MEGEKKTVGMPDVTFNGSVTFNGPMFDIHDNEHVHIYGSKKDGRGESDEPQSASTIHNHLADSPLWQKIKEAGLVDENDQPTVSRTEAALMASELAERLGIAHKWKLFETLWHRNNMRGDFNKALDQRKSLAFQEKLKNILG